MRRSVYLPDHLEIAETEVHWPDTWAADDEPERYSTEISCGICDRHFATERVLDRDLDDAEQALIDAHRHVGHVHLSEAS